LRLLFSGEMKTINSGEVTRALNYILLLETLAFLLCVPIAYIYNESPSPFYWSAALSFIISTVFQVYSDKFPKGEFRNRDGYVVVVAGWLIFSAMGALPYLFSGEIPSVIDACFESTSGLTTTGSSILIDIEALSYSILFWRSLTHWIGGIGIIVLVIIILPSINFNGYQLFTLESSLKEKILPKTKAIGYRILFIYIGLTVIETLLLWMGDMNLFDSICHSFGTVATGGFSPKNTSLINYSHYSQDVVMIFMFLAGVSQVVYYFLIKRNFQKIRNNEELWFYALVVIFTGAIASMVILVNSNSTPATALREGYFQIISVVTCTGFASADYLQWAPPGIMLVFLLMFAGGCTGSTSGGIKMARHIIVLKSVKGAFLKLIHPHVITTLRYNGRVVQEKTAVSVISFVVLYLFIFLVGSLLIITTGLDVVTGSSAVATCMAGIGPGHGLVGPVSNFANIPGSSKIILSFLMIIGRLEIIPVLMILTKSFWRY
jgi:trk system potassium uptake protein